MINAEWNDWKPDPHQQHPLLQAMATVLFESSPYFASKSMVVIEGWSEASSVSSSSSSSSRRSGGRGSSSSVVNEGLFRVFFCSSSRVEVELVWRIDGHCVRESEIAWEWLLWSLTSFSFKFWILILGEGDGFDFWVSKKREEFRVLVLVFRRELGFVLW